MSPTSRPSPGPIAGLVFAACLLVAGMPATQAGSPPPSNDHWANATGVAGTELTLEADLLSATRETFEAVPADQFGHTVWWRWTVPADGLYEWDTSASVGPVAITVWGRDSLGQLVPRASSPRRASPGEIGGVRVMADPRGSVQAAAGETLWLTADAVVSQWYGFGIQWPANPFGSGEPYPARITVRRSPAPTPGNDRFVDRTLIPGTNATLRFRLDGATAEEAEPRLPWDSLQRTVWWTWQAPGNGTARLRSVGTAGAPAFGIYQRGTWQQLQRLTTSATLFGNECYRESRGRDVLEWDVTTGGQYEIQADRYPANLPDVEYQVELEFIPAPANDRLASALLLEGNEIHRQVSNEGATRNPEDPVLPGRTGNGSVWFRWNAPGRGVLQVTTNEPLRFSEPTFEVLPPGGSWSGSLIEIFPPNPCGEPLADMNPPPPFIPAFGIFQVTSNVGGLEILSLLGHGTNAAVAEVEGETRIVLDGLGDTSGETPLNLLFTPPPANDRFENRIVLPSAPVRAGGRTFAARSFFGSPVSGRPAWWQWTAPTSGLWVLRPKTYVPEHLTWLLRGAEYSANIPAYSTPWQPLTFQAAAGEVFQIAVVATSGFGDNVSFQIEPAVSPVITLDRRREVRDQQWTLLDTFEWPSGFDLPRVVETSTDLEHWTEQRSLDDWRFAVPANDGDLRRFYRVRLLSR